MALESKPLSIANVHDGENPFLHTAYAWSSDGKDRFTLQYPNDNLVLNYDFSKDPTTNGWVGNGATIEYSNGNMRVLFNDSSTNRRVYYSNDLLTNYLPAGVKYSVTIDAYSNNNGLIRVGNFDALSTWQTIKQGDTPSTYKFEGLTAGTTNAFSIQGSSNTLIITIAKIKIELGNTATIYTPNPSEDFANAYPLYMGQYSDYTQEPSTNPSQYMWMRTTGQNGASVKSTKTEWAINTSSVDEPTTGWSTTIPTLEKGKYLWTRTTWEYTDSTTSVAYTVNYIPVDGSTGNGVKSIAVTYAVGTSGTTQPSTGWQATPPNVTGGQYLWTRIMWTFTDNTNQTTYSVARFGQDGISVTGTQSEYVQTTSSVEPTTGWSTTRPTPQIGMWLWVRSRNTLSNGTYTNWVVTSSYTGRDSIFISATAPSNPTTGTLWQKPNDPTVLKWNGTAWENWGMSINNIVADNVIAENGMFKKVSGVEIVGSTIRNPYNVKYSDNSTGSGEITLENSQIKNNIKQYSSTGVFKNAHSQIMAANFILMATTNEAGNTIYNQLYLDPDALSLQTFSSDPNSGGNGYGAEYSSTGLRLTDSRVSLGNSKLEIHDLIKVETTILDPASGWQRYSDVMGYTNTPTATRVGRTVQIAGAFKPINQLSAGQYIINQPLPVWARPLNNVTLIHQGSGMNRLLLEVRKDGTILVSRYGTTVDSAIPSGAWINISCVYAGQDLF